MLTTGVCDVDPVRHAEARHIWHLESPGQLLFPTADLHAAVAGDEPIVVWGTRAFSDLVWIWWALDGLARIGVDRERCYLARPDHDDRTVTVGGTAPEYLQLALANAHRITDDEWREATALWFKFASPSPLAFDEARRAGGLAFPELTASADVYGAWFPRLHDNRISLSLLDEALLAACSDERRTTREILDQLSDEQDDQRGVFDACFPIERLQAWAELGVLERQSDFEVRGFHDDPFVADRFRATDLTRSRLTNGLDHVDSAPVMYIGGCRINDSATPFLRVDTDGGWRLVAG
ncbi:MAG: hypothetical protein QM831_27360 [Kofleriaceae bacterium]